MKSMFGEQRASTAAIKKEQIWLWALFSLCLVSHQLCFIHYFSKYSQESAQHAHKQVLTLLGPLMVVSCDDKGVINRDTLKKQSLLERWSFHKTRMSLQ